MTEKDQEIQRLLDIMAQAMCDIAGYRSPSLTKRQQEESLARAYERLAEEIYK